ASLTLTYSCDRRRRFFFSSRGRHTRSKRDWSSDVCSSDLARCRIELPGLGIAAGDTGIVYQNVDLAACDRGFGRGGDVMLVAQRSEERRGGGGRACRRVARR